MADKPLQDLVARLEAERLEADRRYNDALTALDAAARALAAPAPEPPPLVPYDPSQLPRVNERWAILHGAYDPRLAHERQQEFNAALVDHLNRNVGSHAEATQAIAGLRAAIAADRAARASFDSALIQFLQRITEYVDTKDRAMGGPELREQIVLANERALATARALARLQTPDPRPQQTPGTGSLLETGAGSLEPVYVGFEDRFRGSQDAIRARVADYVPLFAGNLPTDQPANQTAYVLDVGCGRGELLALLKEAGVEARGIDVNAEMVALCRERGLDAAQADALSHLESIEDGTLAGLAAIQVVEHLEPAYLARFLETAFHKMKPGAALVLETINPACWMAFFEAYIRDLTHAQPIHPDTLKFLVQASGFSAVDVQYRSPVREADRLETVNRPSAETPPALLEAIDALNAHASKLNARLFSQMDYAVVAIR